MSALSPVQGASGVSAFEAIQPTSGKAEPGFADALSGALQRVDGLAQRGDDALVALARGGEVDLHGAMIAMQEAEIAVRAMVTVRDKAVAAYEQLMNLAI